MILVDVLKAHICVQPVDMRKSIDGLSQLVVSVFGADPFGGHLFVFVSKRRDRVKILYWDRHGFALWYKRLERGHFPQAREICERALSLSELTLWLEGIDLTRTRRLAHVAASRVM